MALPLKLSLALVWPNTGAVRRRVWNAMDGYHPELREATSMAASELVENAIKYGENVADTPQISFLLSIDGGVVQITVTNGATSLEAGTLCARISEIAQARDKRELYMNRLKSLVADPSEGGKLGLYRIAYEGGFTLDARSENGVVTVVARRELR